MYDKFPFVAVTDSAHDCLIGWAAIAAALVAAAPEHGVICVECYPGVLLDELCASLSQQIGSVRVFRAEDCYQTEAELNARIQPLLTDDPVFGHMNNFTIAEFFDPAKLIRAQEEIAKVATGRVLVVGTGASLLVPHTDVRVYADMARWELQMRQRRGVIGNLGVNNLSERASLKYKRGFFLDWRAADRLKCDVLPKTDFLLDTNDTTTPKLITGEHLRQGLASAVQRPFRVVPFFDPGPWGGHWMEDVCGLDKDQPNHAWCFDCVPEENSLLLGFGDCRVEIPAMDLVLMHPRELLGERVEARFGAEFPIRFDFLDTMGGGNLSLQVHPRTEYIRETFGMDYTQDESYYMLDARENACVYLGLRDDADPDAMIHDLREAQTSAAPSFDAERYVNKFPAKKHDHFLIPAGTIHCSGANSMVLEISATPYIFTFKLWDWARLGLDGRPRPIHLDHGVRNICWDRRTEWVRRNLVNPLEPLAHGAGWREERTGLHELEFIETRRHWFTEPVAHDTHGTVNVLNLVEGERVVVESPTHAFEPFPVNYAETFIVPAAVGPYTIRRDGVAPGDSAEYATLKAFVRETEST